MCFARYQTGVCLRVCVCLCVVTLIASMGIPSIHSLKDRSVLRGGMGAHRSGEDEMRCEMQVDMVQSIWNDWEKCSISHEDNECNTVDYNDTLDHLLRMTLSDHIRITILMMCSHIHVRGLYFPASHKTSYVHNTFF